MTELPTPSSPHQFGTQRPIPLELELGSVDSRLTRDIEVVAGVILSMPGRMSVFKRGDTVVSLGGSARMLEGQSTWRIGFLMLSDMLSDEDRTLGLVYDAEHRLDTGEFATERFHQHGGHFHFPPVTTPAGGNAIG
jgi:hypothetical protein